MRRSVVPSQQVGERLIAIDPAAASTVRASIDTDPVLLGDMPRNFAIQAGSTDAARYLQFEEGWWAMEPGGCWMQSRRATLLVQLPPGLPSDAVLILYGDSFAGGKQRLRVKLDGRAVVEGDYGLEHPMAVPVGSSEGWTLLELEMPQAPLISPADARLSTDTRTLTGFLAAVELVAPNS